MKLLKFFESSNGRMIGDYFLSNEEYNRYIGDGIFGVDEDVFENYLNILDTYYHRGGEIQRVLFTSKVDQNHLGHHWTHIGNDVDNFIDSLYDFLREEGKVDTNPSITLITGVTPPHNIGVKYALEQYETNYWEEEIYIEDPTIVTNINIRQIK